MSQLSDQLKQSGSGSGRNFAIVILSFLYTAIDRLTANLALPILGKGIPFGISVPAASAIIFGRGIGGLSGGIGELLTALDDILLEGGQINTINIGVLINSVAIGLGAWLTGFLGKENTKEEAPDTYRALLTTSSQWRKVGTDLLGSIIGLAITKNFLYAFGSQLQEGASLVGGTAKFLQLFITDSVALIFILPVTLFGYDAVQILIKKREAILERLLIDIEKTIEVEEGIEILDISLPNGAVTMNKWTPIKLTFRNRTGSSQMFHIDAVSTSRMYPDTDNTSIMDNEATWVQTFYVLPAKQKKVNLRVRITPKTEEVYKGKVTQQASLEVNATTKNPSSITASLLGFSGINFGLVGISAAWDQILATIGNPKLIIDQLVQQWHLIWITLVAETLMFLPILGYIYRSARLDGAESGLRLGFTRGFDYQGMQNRASGFLKTLRDRYEGKLKVLINGLIGLVSIASVGYMGYEAANVLLQPDYQFQNPNLIFIMALSLLGLWIFGVRGKDLIQAIGIGERKPWEYSNDHVITSFKPLAQLQIETPTEVLVKAHNITDQPGVRIVFQGFDSISPQVVELHLDPGESTEFKIAITPLKKELQEVLAIYYPLFDKEQNYIDPNEAEPFAEQEIQYQVQGQTKLGITKSQQSTLKKGLGAGGFLAIAYTFIGQFINLPAFDQFLADNGLIFSVLQTPFLYAYFYFTNKFKSSSL